MIVSVGEVFDFPYSNAAHAAKRFDVSSGLEIKDDLLVQDNQQPGGSIKRVLRVRALREGTEFIYETTYRTNRNATSRTIQVDIKPAAKVPAIRFLRTGYLAGTIGDWTIDADGEVMDRRTKQVLRTLSPSDLAAMHQAIQMYEFEPNQLAKFQAPCCDQGIDVYFLGENLAALPKDVPELHAQFQKAIKSK